MSCSLLIKWPQQQCEKYWHNQHGRYGGVDVWLRESDILADFIVRTFHVSVDASSPHRVVKHFQFNGWSEHDVPSETAVLEYRRKIRDYMRDQPGPLLVHCRYEYTTSSARSSCAAGTSTRPARAASRALQCFLSWR